MIDVPAIDSTLESSWVVLEPANIEHVSTRWVDWLNDTEVTRFSEQRFRQHTLQSCRRYVESFRGLPDGLWLIRKTADLEHVGNIAASIDVDQETADISILVGDRRIWGQGIGSAAWQLLMSHLFDCGLKRVTGGTLELNGGMISVMTKAGMKPAGRSRAPYLLNGRPVDMLHFAAEVEKPPVP